MLIRRRVRGHPSIAVLIVAPTSAGQVLIWVHFLFLVGFPGRADERARLMRRTAIDTAPLRAAAISTPQRRRNGGGTARPCARNAMTDWAGQPRSVVFHGRSASKTTAGGGAAEDAHQ
jgi:hypothetical protein